jgi:hypothetical protein
MTPNTTRRAILAGVSGTALAGTIAARAIAKAAPPHPDEELLALADAIVALNAESHRICLEIDEMALRDPDRDRRWRLEIKPRTDRIWDMRVDLAMMRATTMDGFRAKARVVQEFNNCAPRFADPFNDDAMAWSLANDLLGAESVWRSDEDDAGDAA